jgi:hypothetical protein
LPWLEFDLEDDGEAMDGANAVAGAQASPWFPGTVNLGGEIAIENGGFE